MMWSPWQWMVFIQPFPAASSTPQVVGLAVLQILAVRTLVIGAHLGEARKIPSAPMSMAAATSWAVVSVMTSSAALTSSPWPSSM